MPDRRAPVWLGAGLLYFVLAVITIRYTGNRLEIATVWPANALLLALLLGTPAPRLSMMLSAGLVANIAATALTRGTFTAPFLYAICNMAEVAVAAVLLRRGSSSGSLLDTPRTVLRFILVAGMLAPAISGIGGAATSWLIFGHGFAASFQSWFLSDALGLLICTPFLRAFFSGDYARVVRELSWPERAQALILLALHSAVTVHVFFFAARPLLFALFGTMLLVTFRLGRLGTKLAVLIVAVCGTMATMRGVGPIAMLTTDLSEQAYLFQGYLVVLLMTSLPASAELSARRKLLGDLAESEKALRVRETELSLIAATDSLTGMFNRAAFRERALSAMETAGACSRALCLVAIDLDRFKEVNDNWGHHAGDSALVHFATMMRAHLRGDDMIGRLGGDEFMLLLPAAGFERAQDIVARLKSALHASPLPLEGGARVPLSMSCGIAVWDGQAGLDELARAADAALYRAKAHNRRARTRLVA